MRCFFALERASRRGSVASASFTQDGRHVSERIARGTSGFTFVEMLVCVLILSLLSIMLAAGLPVAMKVYKESVFASESETLGATLNTALSDVMRYATYENTQGNDVHFGSTRYYLEDAIVYVDDYLYLKQEENLAANRDAKTYDLVNRGAYTSCIVRDFEMTYDETTHVFHGSYTIYDKDNLALSKDMMFSFKSLIYKVDTSG